MFHSQFASRPSQRRRGDVGSNNRWRRQRPVVRTQILTSSTRANTANVQSTSRHDGVNEQNTKLRSEGRGARGLTSKQSQGDYF